MQELFDLPVNRMWSSPAPMLAGPDHEVRESHTPYTLFDAPWRFRVRRSPLTLWPREPLHKVDGCCNLGDFNRQILAARQATDPIGASKGARAGR